MKEDYELSVHGMRIRLGKLRAQRQRVLDSSYLPKLDARIIELSDLIEMVGVGGGSNCTEDLWCACYGCEDAGHRE